jgi:LAO/AO transport system kinase
MNDVAPPDIPALAAQIAAGDRPALARAITLVESRREDHRQLAAKLIETLLPKTGNAIRIGMRVSANRR